MAVVYLLPLLVLGSSLGTYIPGTPGADWSIEEADVVKEKLLEVWSRISQYQAEASAEYLYDPHSSVEAKFYYYGTAKKALRLAFHDCLKYTDGTGGCDGCLNFDYTATNVATDNNGLQPLAALLEKIYRDPDWPSKAPAMETSLYELGKSRADLWTFAGLVALQSFAQTTNDDCGQGDESRYCEGRVNGNFTNCRADIQGLSFQTGRADCVTDEPLGFVTKKVEAHPNPNGNGEQTVNFFKENFDFTMRETVAIMGAHTIGKFNNPISGFLYSWVRETTDILNTEYYRLIAARPEYALESCIGDEKRKPAETKWAVLAEGKGSPPYNGRLIWFHKFLRCPDCIAKPSFEYSKFKSVGGVEECCSNLNDGNFCQPSCVKFVQKDQTAMNCEMGLFYKFDIDPDTLKATGCPGFDSWKHKGMTEPGCPMQDLETEEGIPLHQVVEEYADGQNKWIGEFIPAMMKMQRNGYSNLNQPIYTFQA